MTKHLVIPDGQVKPGVCLDHWTWIGNYIVDKKPDVIINIGDFADMESLCSYDKGKKDFENRRYKDDIECVVEAMDLLLAPMKAYNAKQKAGHRAQYKPRMVMTMGNHEERIARVDMFSPELEGICTFDDLPYTDWEVVEFLKPICIDGIWYAHYFKNPSSLKGNPIGGTMDTKLKNLGHSFTQGHQQILQFGLRPLSNGQTHYGLVCGSCYLHDEDYLGNQSNHYWRGIIMKNRVQNGEYDPCMVSLAYLKETYGNG